MDVAVPNPEADSPDTTDAGIVKEALERFKATEDWEGVPNEWSRQDTKFANADSRNTWQWPTKIYQQRTGGGSELPTLTINNTRVHNDLIINSISKNRYGVKVRPTGGDASYKSAEAFQRLVRRTQNISRATSVFRQVTEHQVDGGIGYVLIETDYVSNKSRDQDIFLRSPRDPTGIRLDPWIKRIDGLDADFGFVFEKLPREEFNRKHPKYKNKVGLSPLESAFSLWLTDKEIVLAKYFRKKKTPNRLVWWVNPDGSEFQKLASEIKKESGDDLYKQVIFDIDEGKIDGGYRETTDDEVEWFLIAGETIVERGKWAGKYIPICRCVGRETVIDGTLDRKGMTRSLIDGQRMLNYNASMATQMVAWQPQAPWLAPARAIEGQEAFKSANVNAFAVLTYNDIDEEAPAELQKIPPPQRLELPKPSEAHVAGMQAAERWMMMTSGQFQAQMGENDTQSAASGKAINERQQQGDTATYHFPEHQSDMLRAIGVQLIDLYPKIYDTKRVLHDEGEKGERIWIEIDPDQTDAVRELEQLKEEEASIRIALNPSIGEYECVSDPGPDYATQRQEAWNAMSIILQQNMQLAAVIGDLMFRYGDFDGADEIADRMQKEIKATKPYLFNDGADPGLAAMQQQLQKLTALNAELVNKLAAKQLELKGKQELRDVEAHRADTDRMGKILDFISKVALTPAQQADLEHQLTAQAHQHVYDTVAQANQADIDAATAGQTSTE